jgi:hypothetical protein
MYRFVVRLFLVVGIHSNIKMFFLVVCVSFVATIAVIESVADERAVASNARCAARAAARRSLPRRSFVPLSRTASLSRFFDVCERFCRAIQVEGVSDLQKNKKTYSQKM